VLVTVIAIIAIAIAALLAMAGMRPDHFRIERSTRVPAPAGKAFALINDFHHWPQWSPWENKDPSMKKTLSGTAAGTGAIYEWEGNNQVGQGRMEITDSTPDSRVLIKLDFYKPFEAHNTTEFTIAADGEGSRVTWAMYGPQPFMARLMGIFFSMEKMVGPDFEAGLAKLATAAGK
jgi:hypothetical protein